MVQFFLNTLYFANILSLLFLSESSPPSPGSIVLQGFTVILLLINDELLKVIYLSYYLILLPF